MNFFGRVDNIIPLEQSSKGILAKIINKIFVP